MYNRSYPRQFVIINGQRPAEVVKKIYRRNKLYKLVIVRSNAQPKKSEMKGRKEYVETIRYYSDRMKFKTLAPTYKRLWRKLMKTLVNWFKPLPGVIIEKQ